MRIRIKLGRRNVEAVTEKDTYPEPWLLGGFLYRALLGRPMDNVRWTNSTFWRSASTGEASWWLRLAGWHRALIRVCCAWVLMLTLPMALMLMVDELRSYAITIVYWHLVALSPVLLLLDFYFVREHGVRIPWRVKEQETEALTGEQMESMSAVEQEQYLARECSRWRMLTVVEGRRVWEQEVVEPLAAVVSAVLGDACAHRPGEARHWIDVPRNYLTPKGAPVEIQLPRSYTGATTAINTRLVSAARSSLGMLEADAQWLLKGRSKRLLLTMPPAPPEKALFAQYEQLLMSTQEYRPYLGVVASGELLSAEMVSDSPHIALSAGSGAGKSMLMRSIIMQALHWGWAVIILDWKAESHEWAEGLPGVKYVKTTEGIHDMGVRLGEEVEIRKGLSKEDRAARPRVLVVREEWNMTAALLSDYWTALRSTAEPDEKRTMPLRSPALLGFQAVDFAGRSFGVFDLLAAQRMSNRVFNGNVDVRENFMIRILARYTVQTWKMLLPHLKYMRKPDQLGRWVVAAGDEATYVQGILISDEEAQRFARAGAPNPMSAFSQGRTQRNPVQATECRTLEDQLRPDTTGHNRTPLELPPVLLRKLIDIATSLEYLGITHNVLRNASRGDAKGDDAFPPVRGGNQFSGYLYDVSEVTDWAKKLRARQAAEKTRVRG